MINQTNAVCCSEESKPFPAAITKAASKQTYYTVYCLVDRHLIDMAYQAYAYFRWLDDFLDENLAVKHERTAFVQRQAALVEACYSGYNGKWQADVSDHERMIVDLIRRDTQPNSGLQLYIQHMMAVMAFDAERRGRLIYERELNCYSQHLAIAVTEALHHFIGNGQYAPQTTARYLAATASHITHMLRDACEDIANGYFNIPVEVLKANRIDPGDVESAPYRSWVKGRVELAQRYFQAGKTYLRQVKSLRCRIAGYAYIARFEGVLTAIARDGYRLRAHYHECKSALAGLSMGWFVCTNSFHGHSIGSVTRDSLKA